MLADFCCHTLGDIADMVSIGSKHLDSVRIVGVGGFSFEGTNKLAEVVVYVVAMGHAGDMELNNIKLVVVFWPYAHMVAFVFDAEVLEFADGHILVTVRVNGYSDERNGRFYILIVMR
jgi:hypothetical protein